MPEELRENTVAIRAALHHIIDQMTDAEVLAIWRIIAVKKDLPDVGGK